MLGLGMVFLALVAVTCIVAVVWLRFAYRQKGERVCGVCRSSGQCQPGVEGQCCCRLTDADGCYYGIGLCVEGLTCVPNATDTGICVAVNDPAAVARAMTTTACQADNYTGCLAASFGDCCCPTKGTDTPTAACSSPGLECHRDDRRFVAKSGVCVPKGLAYPSPTPSHAGVQSRGCGL